MADERPLWLRDLTPARFAGVEFEVFGHTREGGRRGPDHEYPQRDIGIPEDLGRKMGRLTFDAFVIGEDYHARAQELIEVLEAGAGLLEHPRWGLINAICRSYTEQESAQDSGMARFTLQFVEDLGEEGLYSIGVDELEVAERAATLATAAQAGFADRWSVAFGGYVFSRVIEHWAEIWSRGGLTELSVGYRPIDPTDATIIATSVAALLATVTDAGELLQLTRQRVADGYDPASPPPTPVEQQVQINRDAQEQLVQRLVLGQLAAAIVEEEYDSYDEAVEARDEVADLIWAEMESVCTYDEFVALVDLRASTVATLTTAAQDLARLRTIEVTTTTSALQLAWDIYGAATRAEEIVARNRIRHPLFVEPGTYTVLVE
ncbi:MAG: DNA circularization N-terminal domain-containing protein [Gemmatimonadales bacterium]|jgi:prophage DNA circulation protein